MLYVVGNLYYHYSQDNKTTRQQDNKRTREQDNKTTREEQNTHPPVAEALTPGSTLASETAVLVLFWGLTQSGDPNGGILYWYWYWYC